MNKEAIISQIDQANFRIARIEPAIGRLGKAVAHIQYRCPTPQLKSILANVHNRKLAEELAAHKSEKTKDPFRKNAYIPRALDDTLNETARNIKGVSLPYLEELEKTLRSQVQELEMQLPVGLQLRRVREGLKISMYKLGQTTGMDTRCIGGVENGSRSPSEKTVGKYCQGLGLNEQKTAEYKKLAQDERKKRKRMFQRSMRPKAITSPRKERSGVEPGHISNILSSLREKAGVFRSEIAMTAGMFTQNVKDFEEGRRAPNEKTVRAYAAVLNLDPERVSPLIAMIPEERKARRRKFYKAKKEKDTKTETEKTTLGQKLRNLREQAGISTLALAEETGLSHQGISKAERNTVSEFEEITLIKLLKSPTITLPNDMLPPWYIAPKNEGEFLRMVRVKVGITKAEFARITGRNHSSISATESGGRHPSGFTIQLYEDVLGAEIIFPDFSAIDREIAQEQLLRPLFSHHDI